MNKRKLAIGHANTWHDPAIAIAEGEHLFAEGLERHTQCKRSLDMPRLWYSWRSVRDFLCQIGGWPIEEADVVSLSSWSGQTRSRLMDQPGANPIPALLASSLLLEPLYNYQLRWLLNGYPPRVFAPPSGQRAGVSPAPGLSFVAKPVLHQLAHAANAVYTSPFDECVVLVADGYSEGTALTFFHFHDNTFDLLHQEEPRVSLGLLYGLVTQFCGFNPYEGEEWKVMGLAAFGEARQDVYEFFRQRLVVDGLSVSFRPPPGRDYAFDTGAWSELEALVGGFRGPNDQDVLRAADLAHNFQRCFTDTLVDLTRNAGNLGLSKNLAYVGGCALNSAANGQIVPNTAFEQLHVPSAPGDDGNALGVVLFEKHFVCKEPRAGGIASPYLGSELDSREIEKILGFGGIHHRQAEDEESLCVEVAELLAAGKIVAWVQGRAEFGPRALGNRSILADPRAADMGERINQRVKFREFYRPLAPAILDAEGPEYFENYQTSPYMERTLTFREAVRVRVPAAVHHDGTGRPQSVRREWNPLFHALISAFRDATGISIVLNTSFNVMGKPIVHTAQDAIAVFFTTGLDHLVIGRTVLSKAE